MKRSWKIGILITLVAMVPVTWEGCGAPTHEFGTALESSSSAGFKEFKNGFYQFTQTQNCKQCHASQISPFFASSDVHVAYNWAKQVIDFHDPLNSEFIPRATNDHCGVAACSSANKATVDPKVQQLLLAWASAEISAGATIPPAAGPKYFTETVNLPATVPTISQNPALVRFNLSTLNPAVPEWSNAVLEIQVQLSNVTEYRIRNPKIVGASSQLTLKGLHLYVRAADGTGKGGEDTSQGLAWTSIESSVPVVAKPNPLPATTLTATALSTAVLYAAVEPGAKPDAFTIGIDDVTQAAPAPATPASVRFTDLVSTNQQLGVFNRACISCHGAVTKAAGLDLTNYTAAKAAATKIQTRINSALSPMPPAGQLPAADRNVIGSWITAGTPQ